MINRFSTLAFAYVGAMVNLPTRSASSCGFIIPRATFGWSTQRVGLWMESSQKRDEDINAAASRNQGEDGLLKYREEGRQGESPDSRFATQAIEGDTGVTESGTRRRSVRRPDPPPDISGLQTKSQRRRSLPLSQLKRVKPKRIIREEEEEVEYRPLLPKTDRESVLRGEDYWIDFKELDKQAARKKARARAPSPGQFAQSKMRAEIVSPYKQNWILAISIAIVAVAGFIKLNPGILDESIITFPGEL